MIDINCLFKNAVVTVALIVILSSLFPTIIPAILSAENGPLFATIFAVITVLDLGWPKNWDGNPHSTNNPHSNNPHSNSPAQKTFCKFITTFKFLMNAHIQNHISKNTLSQLLQEQAKEIGHFTGNPELTNTLLQHAEIHLDNTTAMMSKNPSRSKQSITALRQVEAKLASQLKVPQAVVKAHNDLIIGMAVARIEQNWLRDLKFWTQLQDSLPELSLHL